MKDLRVKFILEAVDRITAPIVKLASLFKSSSQTATTSIAGTQKAVVNLGQSFQATAMKINTGQMSVIRLSAGVSAAFGKNAVAASSLAAAVQNTVGQSAVGQNSLVQQLGNAGRGFMSLLGSVRNFGTSAIGIMSQVGTAIEQMGEKAEKVGMKMSLRVSAPIGGYGYLAVHDAATMEQNRISLQGMAGGPKQAQALMNQLNTFAAKSPFRLNDVVNTARMLMGTGKYNAKTIMPVLGTVGDLAAGTKSTMSDMAFPLMQTSALGYAQGYELREMAFRGLNLYPAIAKAMNINQKDIRKVERLDKITLDVYLKALRTMTSRGGAYQNMMANQSQTITGLISTLQDNVQQANAKIGDEIVKDTDFGDKIRSLTALAMRAADAFTRLPQGVKSTIVWVAVLAAAMGPALVAFGQFAMGLGYAIKGLSMLPAFFAFVVRGVGLLSMGVFTLARSFLAAIPAILSFGAAMLANPLTWIALAIAAIAFAAYEIIKHWSALKEFFTNFFVWLGNKLDWMGNKLAMISPVLAVMGYAFRSGPSPVAPGGGTGSSGALAPARPIYGPKSHRVDVGGKLTIQLDQQNRPTLKDRAMNDARIGLEFMTGALMAM